MFRDTFRPGSRPKVPCFPYTFDESRLKPAPESDQNSACFEPFLTLLPRKTCFLTPFCHLLLIQAAPLVGSGMESVVTFHGKVTKRTKPAPSLNQPESDES